MNRRATLACLLSAAFLPVAVAQAPKRIALFLRGDRGCAAARDPHDAWDDVEALMTWNPVPVDRALLEAGRNVEARYRLSWWDSLIVAAAQLQGCTLLLTEDLQDGASYGGVTVRSPFTLAVSEAASAYQAVPVLASRHRPRARPRKAVAA